MNRTYVAVLVALVALGVAVPTAYAASSDYFSVTIDIIMHNYYELESVKLSTPVPAAITGTKVVWDKAPHALTSASTPTVGYWDGLKVKLVLDVNGKQYTSPIYTVMTDRWETHVKLVLRNGVYHVKVLAYRLDTDGKWVLQGQSTATITVKGSWVPFAVLGVGVIAVVAAMAVLATKALSMRRAGGGKA